ncbi:MAG: tetratricopeptide repeat protein [Gammaproteobacteria bacterium]|nr:tetratricopeptide repeat protein [Gammaproteobacteria bacterium]MDH5652756.1 tetratricopeptide repeat protein [Gammaproteobacteria bacterium]
MKSGFITLILCLALAACDSRPKRPTLRDIDIVSSKQTYQNVYIKPKSEEEIRQAYEEYLKHATTDTSLRLSAINRLAELEFELGNKIQKEKENLKSGAGAENDDKLYNERLDKTIELLSSSLRDFPKSKGNDKTLYQLAKAYDMRGDLENSRDALAQLVTNHPKSPYFVESQFRLAEIYFAEKRYREAETAYTSVISAKKSELFYEKAIFKRGWSRFKQEFYEEAIDDFLISVTYHGFADYDDLTERELQQFNEYFRAIGLCFSYLGGAEPINNFFKENQDFKYLYYTYAYLSDIYRKQLLFTDAIETLNYFNKTYPDSPNIPESQIKILEIWKESGFTNQLFATVENVYKKYNPGSEYWVKVNPSKKIYKNTSASLEQFLLMMAAHYHSLYQKKHKNTYFNNAQLWYDRYIQHYSSHARKNNIHFLYAELLAEHKDYDKSLQFYEQAAYDSDIILNKDAAYATITITNNLLTDDRYKKNRETWLTKHIKYATLFTRLYPDDKRSLDIISNAAAMAFRLKLYPKAIELADLIPSNAQVSKATINAQIVKAHSFFELQQYANAEVAYQSILDSERLGEKTRSSVEDKLALSIYKQGSAELTNKNYEQATGHFLRISDTVAKSSIAATGLYDAIALAMEHNRYKDAIVYIKRFKTLYPSNKYSIEVSKKLSVAYLKSGMSKEAADEYVKLSRGGEQDSNVRVAALWKAAELYEEKKDIPAAISSYTEITQKYQRPYPQYLEAMQKIVTLYELQGNHKMVNTWQHKIMTVDKRASKKNKSDRTNFIAATASLNLARNVHAEFNKQQLTLPLERTLKQKKQSMQKAVEYYGRASSYGLADASTEATYAIAEIYRDFSKALINSERPKHLKGEELAQYSIVLEDKAFPFEEKAIEFFETNMSRVNNGVYNEWIKKSHARLIELFPVRYKREAILDDYVNVLH